MKDLSIIIVNYNTKELTSSCIASIFRYTKGVSYEVIIVDNASTDGSIEILSENPGIKFVEAGDNIGFGKANNLGYSQSEGDVVLFLNSDTLINNDVLSRVVHFFKKQPENVGMVGITLQDKNGQPAYSYGVFPDWKQEFRIRRNDSQTKSIPYSPFQVDIVSGADLFVKRSHIEKIGLFDTDFFMYYEDTELAYRYKNNGLRAIIISEDGIVHLEGASSKHAFQKVFNITQSYLLYLKKTLPSIEWALAKRLIKVRRIVTVWKYGWTLKEKLQYIKMIILFK